MTDQAKGNLIGLLFVAFIAAIGAYIVYIGLGKLGRGANDAPGWVLVVAGAAFLFAAASKGLNIIGWFFFGARAGADGGLTDSAPYGLRAAQIALSLGVAVLLATVGIWVAFNPESASNPERRVAFAVGAFTIVVMIAGLGFWKLRLRK
jgi:hypothetical protein